MSSNLRWSVLKLLCYSNFCLVWMLLSTLVANSAHAYTSPSMCTAITPSPMIVLDRTINIPQDSQSLIQLSATDFQNFETTSYVQSLPTDLQSNIVLGQLYFGIVDDSVTSSTFGVVSKGPRFPQSLPVPVLERNGFWVLYAPPRYQHSRLAASGVSYEPMRLSIIVTPVQTKPEVGGTGASIAFDGFDDIYSHTILDWPQSAFTFTFWVRAESHSSNQVILTYEPIEKTAENSCQYALVVHDVSSLKVELPMRSFVYDTKLSVVGKTWYYFAIMLSRFGDLYIYHWTKSANGMVVTANGVSTTSGGLAPIPSKGLLHLGQDMHCPAGPHSATCTNAGNVMCYRPLHGEMDDVKLFDTLRDIDDLFSERFLVQTIEDEKQLLAEGITMILALTFDDPGDLALGNFGSGILERTPRRMPSTTGIQSFGNSVQSFEILSADVDSDIAAGLNCRESGTSRLTKKIMNLEVKQISDGLMTTVILTVPSHGCLYDKMPEVPKLLAAGSRLQQNPNAAYIPLIYIADATKIKSQMNNPGFFDSFTFKIGSLDAYQSYGTVQMVLMPRPQLPNGQASITLWMTERSSTIVQFPLVGYRPIDISGVTFTASPYSSFVPFQGMFARIDGSTKVLGSMLRPTTSLEFIGYPWIMNFEQTPNCDDQKELGTLSYTATSSFLDAFDNSVYNKAPRVSVGSIYLKCHGVNDAPYVSTPLRVIEAEKNLAMRLEVEDVDSPVMFLALSKMPKKMMIHQTDMIASSSLGLVALTEHSNFDVGWVTRLLSSNQRKCLQGCQTESIVGPVRFSENGNEFNMAAKGILNMNDALEVTVAFAIEFYAKTFDIYAQIPEGISLTISAVKIIDGLEYYYKIWQGVPKPVAYVNNSFTNYGKTRILPKKMWTIDVCPSWVITSIYKFEFEKPVGLQFVSVSAIYAYAFDRPVKGAFRTQLRSKRQLKDDPSVSNPWIHEAVVRVEGIQDASGNETVEVIAYDCASSAIKITTLEVKLFLQGFDHLPRPFNVKTSIDVVQFTDKYISLRGFDPENDAFQIEFVDAVWKSRNATSLWNIDVIGNKTFQTSLLQPGSFVQDAAGRILLVSSENFGGPNAVKIVFRYRAVKDGSRSVDYFVQINILCAVKYRYLESEQRCVLCPPGTICKTIGVIEPELCQPGSYSDDAITCKPCPTGSYADKAGSGFCSLCTGGYYQPRSNQSSCVPCSAGTFINYAGAVRCNECGHTSFSAIGASVCTSCPLNTVAFTRTSSNVSACRCKEGYYESNNRVGLPCSPCCFGAICRGQRHSPFPMENFWSDRSMWNETCLFVQCYDSGACLGHPSTSIPDIEDIDDVVDALAVCNDGLEGRFCSRCKAGFWRSVGAVCRECNLENRDRAGALYFAWFLLYFLGYVLFFCLSFSTRRVITTLYTHNSMMFLLSKTRLKFPDSLAKAFGIHAFFAVDFSFLPHTCIATLLGYEPLDYGETSIFFLGLPLSIVAIVVIQYIWANACRHYGPIVRNRLSAKYMEENKKILTFILSIISNKGKFMTDKDIEASAYRGIHSALQGIFGMWPILAVKSLDLLSCDSLQIDEDGAAYLIANPDWTCFEGRHRQIFPIALFFTFVYVIALPWFLVSILMYGKRMRHFHKEDFIAKYGFLYAKYKASSWYWEYIIFTKRFVIVGGIMIFSRTPLFTLILVDCIILVNLILHTAKSPFTARHENMAETCHLCIQFVVCTCLIVLCIQQYLHWDVARPTYEIVQGWTATLSVGCIILGICVMIAVLAKDQYYWHLYSGELPTIMKFFPCFTNKARVLPENSAGHKHKKQINAYSSWVCGADAGDNVWFMMAKKRLEAIASAGNPTVTSYEKTDDDHPLDENHVSDEAIAQDLDEIEAAAYIKMRAELDSLNKANETYHKSHATIESGILFTEVGIRRHEALASDFQAQLDRLSQRAVYLERLVNDAESRIRESETWRLQLEEEQSQILRLKAMLQPPDVKSPAGTAPKSAFLRKSSSTASKKMFEAGEARSAATRLVPATSVSSTTDSTPTKGNVRLEATLMTSSKSGNLSFPSEH